MSNLGIQIREHLLGKSEISTIVGDRVHQNTIPDTVERPTVWFQRRGTQNEDTLDSEPGEEPFRQMFDLEVASPDIDATLDLADLVRARFHNHRGDFGTTGGGKLQGCFVEDQDDDYQRRLGSGDVGIHVSAFSIEIIPR